MTPLACLIRDEIARGGPVPFRRFMELALYHPEHGYYRRARDPFGRQGDFFTAEQLQPVFGILVAARIRTLFEEMGRPADFTVIELGAGRGEMAEAFSEWSYVPVETGDPLPERFTGVLFSNEFFDALPVDVAVCRRGEFLERRVDWQGTFVWTDGPAVSAPAAAYIERYLGPREEGAMVEVALDALSWLERVARSIERGFVLTIDYGFTRRESVRFEAGTLMSYHRHRALEDVLFAPGERDITAHVCFTALEEYGRARGLEPVRFESLAQTLLAAGEPDQFAAALAADNEADEARRRLQLKTLLFGMGETFRTLLQAKR